MTETIRRSSTSSASMVAPAAIGKTRTASGGQVRPRKQSASMKDGSHVRVAVRCRPMSAKEIKNGHQPIVEFEQGRKVIVNNIGESPSDQLGTRSGERSNLAQVYEFDAAFDWNSSQATVYNSVCRPIVDGVLEGYNGTIFAYGQTGTGKTYTMEGNRKRRRGSGATKKPASASSDKEEPTGHSSREPEAGGDDDSRGMIPRAFKHIFDHISASGDCQFLVRASYMEIYQEEIHDLLRKNQPRGRQEKLKLHERPDTGVYVKDLTSYVCKSIDEIERVMRVGNQNRKVGATDMNEHSSRSHAIFIITIEQQQQQQQQQLLHQSSSSTEVAENAKSNPNLIRVGRLNLVDLAGSERQRKTNNSGQRHKESIKINLSLSALGNVINCLMKINGSSTSDHQQSNNKTSMAGPSSAISDTFHVPYRDSKLTRLLQDSLGGNSRTLMIANIGPASYNYDETINTLNYASRAKCIQNRPKLNEDPKDALLRQLQDEIQELRARLATITVTVAGNKQTIGDRGSPGDGEQTRLELIELREKLASLESKLLNGTNRLGDRLDPHLLEGYTRQQASELERNKAQLADQVDRERMIRDELERREEAELEIKRTYSSVQQEIEAKRALIRQVLLKTKGLRDQLERAQDTQRLELDELDQLQFVLQKELRLKCLIMDNFIPNHHVNQLLPRIDYDERRDSCSVLPIDLPLDYCNLDSESLIQCSDYIWRPGKGQRPRSQLERISETINPNDVRYKCDNVLSLRIVEPTFGDPPKVLSANKYKQHLQQDTCLSQRPTSRIQALVEVALNEQEPDVVV